MKLDPARTRWDFMIEFNTMMLQMRWLNLDGHGHMVDHRQRGLGIRAVNRSHDGKLIIERELDQETAAGLAAYFTLIAEGKDPLRQEPEVLTFPGLGPTFHDR